MSFFVALLFLFSSFFLQAEDLFQEEIYMPDETWLLPHTIYVGDNGRLVVSLSSSFIEAQSFILETRADLQFINSNLTDDIVINRMELERRGSSLRLLIDFVPFAPGFFIMPPIAIPSGSAEPLMLGGIEFTVASILTPESMALSQPAFPLAVPGSGLMVYGGLGVMLLLLVLGVFGFFRVNKIIGPLKIKWRQARFLASLEQKIKLLRTDSTANENVRSELFSNLAGELREFLSFISGFDCRVLTPYEFASLSPAIPGTPEPNFFYTLFKRWDKIRFSGLSIKHGDIIGIIDELEAFFSGFIKAEKNQ